MFKASIVEATAWRCGQRSLLLRTCWWTLVVREAVKLKQEFAGLVVPLVFEGSIQVPGGKKPWRSLKQKPRCGRSLVRLWRWTFTSREF